MATVLFRIRNGLQDRINRLVSVCLLAISLPAGCPPTPPTDNAPTPNADLTELAEYSADAQIADPAGGPGTIIAGRLLVDFENDVSLSSIDQALARHALRRIGIVGPLNLVTAEIQDGRSELDAQAAIETESTVEVAPLAYVVRDDASAGEASPLMRPVPAGGIPETLDLVASNANWHHYVMDTFPAHALVEAIRGTELSDIEIAVVDSGFHTQSGPDAAGSIYLDPDDSDLRGKVLAPIGLVRRDGQPIQVVLGTADAGGNSLLAVSVWQDQQVRSQLHGLAVSSAAVAAGQDVLGTGRHCRLRPVNKAVNGPPDSLGRPTVLTSLDYMAATLLFLDQNASPNLRVINMSWGVQITDEEQNRRARRALWSALLGHELNGRLMVVSAGNDLLDMSGLVPKSLSIPRNPARELSESDLLYRFENLIAVTGSRFPVAGSGLAELFDLLDYDDRHEDRFRVGAFGSNFGDAACVCAPAQEVHVLYRGLASPDLRQGTSYAAPLVAGLAGEMFTVDPNLTAGQAIDILQRTADDLVGGEGAPGWDRYFGHGRVNCWKAILTVLNRADPLNPRWLGVRFRTPLAEIVPAQFLLDGQAVAGTRIKRVRDSSSTPGGPLDQAREVPYESDQSTLLSSLFSFEATPLAARQLGRIPLLEVRNAAGVVQLQLPLRVEDWLAARVPGSSHDDFVITIEQRNRTGAVYGRVMDGGVPVAGANVRYTRGSGSEDFVFTDAQGFYAAYDVMPDVAFEMDAGVDDRSSRPRQVTVAALRAAQVDFQLDQASLCGESAPLPAWSNLFLFERYTEQTPGVPLVNTTDAGQSRIVVTGSQTHPQIHFGLPGVTTLSSWGNGPVFNYAIAAQGGTCIVSPVPYGAYDIAGAPRNPSYVYPPEEFPIVAPPLLRGEPYRVSVSALSDPADANSRQTTGLVFFSLPPCPDSQQDCDCDNVGRTPGISPFGAQSFIFLDGSSRPGIGSLICRLGMTVSGGGSQPTIDWIGGPATSISLRPVDSTACTQHFVLVRANNSTATISPPYQIGSVPTGFVQSCPAPPAAPQALTPGREYVLTVHFEAAPSQPNSWFLQFRVK